MYFLLALTFLSAALDWYAVYKGWKKLEYFLKPAAMILLFSWFLVATDGLTGMTLWFGVGLILSLAGDIFLMLPKEQFIAGLVAFLLAHLAYILGFNPTFPPFTAFGLLLFVIVAAIAKELYLRIAAGLQEKDKSALQKPVLAYTSVIAIMLLSALFTLFRADWSLGAVLTVSLGAALFMLSDAILAWNKFVQPIQYGRVMNMATYHLGQIILMVGVWMYWQTL